LIDKHGGVMTFDDVTDLLCPNSGDFDAYNTAPQDPSMQTYTLIFNILELHLQFERTLTYIAKLDTSQVFQTIDTKRMGSVSLA
jgi:hypothetical protein